MSNKQKVLDDFTDIITAEDGLDLTEVQAWQVVDALIAAMDNNEAVIYFP